MQPRRGNHEPPQDYAKSAYPHLDVGVARVVDRVVKLREEDSRAEEHDPGEQRDHQTIVMILKRLFSFPATSDSGKAIMARVMNTMPVYCSP